MEYRGAKSWEGGGGEMRAVTTRRLVRVGGRACVVRMCGTHMWYAYVVCVYDVRVWCACVVRICGTTLCGVHVWCGVCVCRCVGEGEFRRRHSLSRR